MTLRRAWEREYAELRAYTTSYRDDLDRGIEFLLGYLEKSGQELEGLVLETGCGRGRNAIPLAEAGHTVIGVDYAFTPLVRFSQCVTNNQRAGAAWPVQHDIRTPLPLRAGAVSVVLDVTAVDNIVDQEQRRGYGLEVARVLKNGGVLLVVTFARNDGYYGPMLQDSTRREEGVVEDPNTGIRNQLFTDELLMDVFSPPLKTLCRSRLVFVDEAAEGRWTRRFLIHLYAKT